MNKNMIEEQIDADAALEAPIALADVPVYARVPEHGVSLMRGLSGGGPLLIGDYLFFCGDEWLSAIGYPLRGEYVEEKFKNALDEAIRTTKPVECFAIAQDLSGLKGAAIEESDGYLILAADAGTPKKVRNAVARARKTLSVSESLQFTPQHRRLWAEFIQRTLSEDAPPMSARVRELYAKTPFLFREGDAAVRFLDARDEAGRLVASLLLDFSARDFTSYVIGAHSREFYVPHAHDLLFSEMLARSASAGKKFIHLGLRVNEGITRFKLKWGAEPYFSYQFARWREKGGKIFQIEDALENEDDVGRTLALAIMRHQGGLSARQVLGNDPERKPFAMLWRVEKNGQVSWLAGAAHFFRYSFEPSFRKLFKNVDNVIFEAPLDADFMAQADEAGRTLPKGMRPLIDSLSEEEILNLEKTVWGPQDRLRKALGMAFKNRKDVRGLLRHSRPWHAFFSLWSSFLERLGWTYSVDMEAWRTAQAMGKNLIPLETLEEQLDSLASLPVERALNFFRSAGEWKRRANRNMRAYLAGDLEKMMGTSAEFPTRTEYVVGRRDQRFRERMRPYLEEGRTAVFVGTAHLVNLREMLAEDGFSLSQRPFGLMPKIRLRCRRLTRPEEVRWQAT